MSTVGEAGSLPRIVLASASPRRSELLSQIGLSFSVQPTDIDESERPGEDPVSYVQRLAIGKVMVPGADGDGEGDGAQLFVAADTTVDVDGQILAKPEDDTDARRMLGLLSGRTHQVHTGVAVRFQGRVSVAVCTSLVTMAVLGDELIDWYIGTGEPHGKAGAYAIQGAAAMLVTGVEGSVTNVIGLPLHLLDQLFGDVGISLVRLLTP